MAKADLTAQRLRELLDYDPETGVFLWKIAAGPAKPGMEAGWLVPEGYRAIWIGGRQLAHRLAWLYVHGEWPKAVIDHINGDGRDNRLANLRDAPTETNAQNRRHPQRNNTSGYLGVSWSKTNKGWVAQISVKKKFHFLGKFDSPEEAHEAYIKAKRRLHAGCTI